MDLTRTLIACKVYFVICDLRTKLTIVIFSFKLSSPFIDLVVFIDLCIQTSKFWLGTSVMWSRTRGFKRFNVCSLKCKIMKLLRFIQKSLQKFDEYQFC